MGGMEIRRELLARLASRCPLLQEVEDDSWCAVDGPLATVYLRVLRILLHWATTGRLLYPRELTKRVHDALKTCGAKGAARAVKRLEAQECKAEEAEKAEKASKKEVRRKVQLQRQRRSKEGSKKKKKSMATKKKKNIFAATKLTK